MAKILPKPRRRTLVNGTKVREEASPLKWSFESKCPGKWLHIDTETGKIYAVKSAPNNIGYSFPQPSDELLEAGSMVLMLETSRRKNT